MLIHLYAINLMKNLNESMMMLSPIKLSLAVKIRMKAIVTLLTSV